MRKITKEKQILVALAASTLATLEILDDYSLSKGSVYRSMKRDNARQNAGALELQRFYSMLNRLKRDGLIKRKKTDKGVFWDITFFGLNKLKILEENKVDYKSESDNKFKIILYDIPEKERKKRAWLREVLRRLEFKMLQQSAWIGKNKIPEDFLADLQRKNLLPFIHILEVTKTGTVRELA